MRQLWIAIGGLLFSTQAHGAMMIIASEVNGHAEFTYSGTLDLTGLTQLASNRAETREQGFIRPRDGSLVSLALTGPRRNATHPYDSYAASSFARFGTTTPHRGAARGQAFGLISSGQLLVPHGYQSGAPINGRLIFFNQTFEELGLADAFERQVTLRNGDTITLIKPEPRVDRPIPLPASGFAFLTGIAALALGMRVRQRRRA